MAPNDVTEVIIGSAIEVHRALGPGLLESIYEECLAIELGLSGMNFQRQVPIPIHYKGRHVGVDLRIDLRVENVIVELKAVEKILPVHQAQLLTYLRLTGTPLGVLINFNVRLLKDGVRRLITLPLCDSVPLW